jgi:hypothetical protein
VDKEEKEALKPELLAASPFLGERFAEETFYKARGSKQVTFE